MEQKCVWTGLRSLREKETEPGQSEQGLEREEEKKQQPRRNRDGFLSRVGHSFHPERFGALGNSARLIDALSF